MCVNFSENAIGLYQQIQLTSGSAVFKLWPRDGQTGREGMMQAGRHCEGIRHIHQLIFNRADVRLKSKPRRRIEHHVEAIHDRLRLKRSAGF